VPDTTSAGFDSIAEKDSVLTKEEIEKDESLQILGPLGYSSTTNYKVTEQQIRPLNDRWDSKTERPGTP
jgi:hypothetical protein